MIDSPPAEVRRWEDEVVYGIITEKFADGDPSNNLMSARFGAKKGEYEGGFWGGDLKGVIGKLDDLADLGVTTILLYPVVKNDEGAMAKYLPTGYRPRDYEQVDPNFGDISTLRALVDGAHARGIRLILDMPITLPGFEHPYLADPGKAAWFGTPSEYGVRRWKAENPAVADYLIGVCRRWKERTGCDGFRIDSAHLQPTSFWKRFVAELKGGPDARPFVIVPELTVPTREVGEIVAEAGFDGAYDFSVLRAREVFGKGEDVGLLSFIATEAHRFYRSPRSMLAPIDNYEQAFISAAAKPRRARTRLALAYILTLDRVPLLYAGNELGRAIEKAGDAFPGDRKSSPFLAEVKGLIALRRREQALRRGGYREVLARDGMLAYLREEGEARILVVLNGTDRAREFARAIGDRPWKEARLTELVGPEGDKPRGSDAPLAIEPFGYRIGRVD